MPNFLRKSLKYAVRGVGLASPPDLLAEGLFPILNNVRVISAGTVTSRDPLEEIIPPAAASPVLTIRRLNDPTNDTFARIATDAAGNLMANGVIEDTGYSGNPTQMAPFRPLQTPRPWMYVADSAKMRKIRSDGVNYLTGIVPPNIEPQIARGVPAYVDIADFQGTAPIASWVAAGTAGSHTTTTRFSTTISKILYDSGSTGWCSMILTAMDPATPGQTGGVQPGAFLNLNSAEQAIIRDVFPAINTTTIAGITYDTGTTGLCSVVLAAPVDTTLGLIRDALVELNTELVRVLSVSIGENGIPSFRCSTTGAHSAGETVTGFASLRIYTAGTYAATNTVTGVAINSNFSTGYGTLTFTGAYNLTSAASRPIGPDDYIHISLYLTAPWTLTELDVVIDISASAGAFTDYFYYPVTPNYLQSNASNSLGYLPTLQTAVQNTIIQEAAGSAAPGQSTLGANQWVELFINVSDLIRVGSDQTRTLANVGALRVQMTTTGYCDLAVSSWWIGGTYGLDSGVTGSPFQATYRWRANSIGSRSNPAPASRSGLYLRREELIVSGIASSSDPQVDTADLFVFGGQTNDWRLVSSNPSSQSTVSVDITNAALAVSELLQFDNFVPYPTSDLPRAGICTVNGTTVTWIAGDQFNLQWTPGSAIVINGTVYTLYNSPTSATQLQIGQSAGAQFSVPFQLAEATLYGTPLPYMCDGGDQNSNVVFSAGDPNNPGYLYWSNPNDPDTASDTHNAEITAPGEPLGTPFTWNGQAYVYSCERLFVLSPAAPVGNQRVNFIAQEVPGCQGNFAPWYNVVSQIPYFGGREGIYQWAGGDETSISEDSLYPIFPHDESVGYQVYSYLPVDTTKLSDLRLFHGEKSIFFLYKDTGGTKRCMRYDRAHGGGWFPENYTPAAYCVYEEEGIVPYSVLIGGADGGIYQLDDSGTEVVACQIRTPALDLGDTRSQKLFTDAMADILGSFTAEIFYDNFNSSVASGTISSTPRNQIPIPIASNSLGLYRNIALDLTWTGEGTIFEFQPAAELQPYLSATFISQAVDHGFATYGHMREGRLALISASQVTFTAVLDGVSLVLFIAPSTGGLYKKLYFPTPPAKGKLILYKAISTQPFSLFPDETLVSIKEWGASSAYQQYKPFAGMMNG